MSRILNVGMLDVREIKEEIAKVITTIENVGLFIESDESQELLKHVKKENIGSSIKIPIDKNIEFIKNNGSMKIDRDYLEGIDGILAILINGDLRFTEDVTSKLINEKIYLILINGKLICPKSISGTLLSKTTINGNTITHKNGYIFFPGITELNNRFLKGFREKSKLSFEKLVVGEKLDTDLLNEKIDNIEVVEELIAIEKYEDDIYSFIDEYYAVEKEIIPFDAKDIRYLKEDTKLSAEDIKGYDEIALYVDGDVEISLDNDIDFTRHIVYILCDKLTLDEKYYPKIKNLIGTNVDVELISGRFMVNKGRMNISKDLSERVSIKNMGKLIFEDNVDVENLDKFIHTIYNYGLIEAPTNLIAVLNNKANKNYGKIREPLLKPDDKIIKEQEKEDIMYSNMGELKI